MAAMTGMSVQCPACTEQVSIPCQLMLGDAASSQAVLLADTGPLRDHIRAHNGHGATCTECKTAAGACLDRLTLGQPACCPPCAEGDTHG